jgi:hypothetical protein
VASLRLSKLPSDPARRSYRQTSDRTTQPGLRSAPRRRGWPCGALALAGCAKTRELLLRLSLPRGEGTPEGGPGPGEPSEEASLGLRARVAPLENGGTLMALVSA